MARRVRQCAGRLLLVQVDRLVAALRGRQGASGLFRGGDNVDSPPDSAFSVNDLADAAVLLRGRGAERSAAGLVDILDAATPALLIGGVHTPNHRWEISAALARLHRLRPQPALAERVDRWLAEGIDIEDGLYSERSANYAAYVSNPSLLTIADVFDRPELVDVVEQSLDATLDLLLPDGSVETVLSRRQDQRGPLPLAPYLLALRRVAQLRGRGDLAWAAELAAAQGIISPGDAAAQLLLDPGIAAGLPAPVATGAAAGAALRRGATCSWITARPPPRWSSAAPTTPGTAGSVPGWRTRRRSCACSPGPPCWTASACRAPSSAWARSVGKG